MDTGRLPLALSITSVVPQMQELKQKKLALLQKGISLQQHLPECIHQEKVLSSWIQDHERCQPYPQVYALE